MKEAMRKRLKISSLFRLLILYLLCAVILICCGIWNRVSVQKSFESGSLVNRHLTLGDFETVQAEVVDGMTLINDGYDTQIIYTGTVRNIYIKCTFSMDPGEFVAFYNKTGDGAWSQKRQRWAKLDDGYYCFEFPGGTKQIRIDTGVEPSIRVDFRHIEINRPTDRLIEGSKAGRLFTWLVMPLLAESVIGIVVDSKGVLNRKKGAADEEL